MYLIPQLNQCSFLFFRDSVFKKLKDCNLENKGEGVGIGKYGLPPHTITEKLQLNYRNPSLRTIKNQFQWKSDNCAIRSYIHPDW